MIGQQREPISSAPLPMAHPPEPRHAWPYLAWVDALGAESSHQPKHRAEVSS